MTFPFARQTGVYFIPPFSTAVARGYNAAWARQSSRGAGHPFCRWQKFSSYN